MGEKVEGKNKVGKQQQHAEIFSISTLASFLQNHQLNDAKMVAGSVSNSRDAENLCVQVPVQVTVSVLPLFYRKIGCCYRCLDLKKPGFSPCCPGGKRPVRM